MSTTHRVSRSFSPSDSGISPSPSPKLQILQSTRDIPSFSHSAPTTPVLFQISNEFSSAENSPMSSPKQPLLHYRNDSLPPMPRESSVPDRYKNIFPLPSANDYYPEPRNPYSNCIPNNQNFHGHYSPVRSNEQIERDFASLSVSLSGSRQNSMSPADNYDFSPYSSQEPILRARQIFKFLDSSISNLESAVSGVQLVDDPSVLESISSTSLNFIIQFATICGVERRTITLALLDATSLLKSKTPLDVPRPDDLSFDPHNYHALVSAILYTMRNSSFDGSPKKLINVTIRQSTTTFNKAACEQSTKLAT